MSSRSLRDKSIDQVLNQLDRLGTVPGIRCRPYFAVAARCTIELGRRALALAPTADAGR